MLVETRTVYRCGFCRRFTKFQARFALAHEVHCRKNPNRTPFLGELTFTVQAGDFNYETHTWLPRAEMPAWWPGAAGMIYADDGWHAVAGHASLTGPDDGPFASDAWPMIDGVRLDEMKPFWRRVQALGLKLDARRQEWADETDAMRAGMPS